MTSRTLTASVLVAMLLAAVWVVAVRGSAPTPLRTAHSEPATRIPPPLVAVTAEGKTFHTPDCSFIHAAAHLESGGQAVADGYVPCTRCLPR
jgi:hypothetical protein